MNYAQLWLCWLSEQMTYPQLVEHMRDDPAFAEYVAARAI